MRIPVEGRLAGLKKVDLKTGDETGPEVWSDNSQTSTWTLKCPIKGWKDGRTRKPKTF